MRWVLNLEEVDRTSVDAVGGKGAHLGALARVEGARVPAGFCVTTDAFRKVLAALDLDALYERLARTKPDAHDEIRGLGADVRAAIEHVAIPGDIAQAIVGRVVEGVAYAVRSSATAEDLPGASFAGQHDSYLGVTGSAEILRHVSRCWASLFTARAIAYRMRHGVDHRSVAMAVVVQRMLAPQASGVLFTADPLSGNRKVSRVEACSGGGEALVSGRMNPDIFAVREGEVVERTVIAASPVVSDEQVVHLVALGRRIEAHFGSPQDIEWCLVDGEVAIVQSRPITTLFPIPHGADAGNRVYVSVGHQQMMTDAMKPLGLSFFMLTTPAPMVEAGGRLFVDITARLAEPVSRAAMLELFGKTEPLVRDAVQTVLDRGDFVATRPGDAPATQHVAPPMLEANDEIVVELIERGRASVANLQREIADKTGDALLDFIEADLQELKWILFDPQSRQVFMAAMEATWWLNERLLAWLGERNAADALAQSVPHNVTSQMGLALLDVADAIRPYPEVVAFLRETQDDDFLDALSELEGGKLARDAIADYLEKYGMRCVGEIDMTRPRWSERPRALVPLILANVDGFASGEAARRFQRGLDLAARTEAELLRRVRELPDGEAKAAEVQPMIARIRAFMGYREYPKYGMVSRYFVYKRALMAEAERLVQAGVLAEVEDVFFLRFEELQAVSRERRVDAAVITERKAAFERYQALKPPRVLTSDGEAINGVWRRDDVPEGALPGLAVSAGTVEGRARVVLEVEGAELEAGDILVTTYTDPSWAAVFVSVAGLVTEVGGLMTHGAVVAREYGLPAVVAVEGATRRIRDGERIRVHGTAGYVERLEREPGDDSAV